MGSLTSFLQAGFRHYCPKNWLCESEVPLVDSSAGKRLGFSPRADVRLSHRGGERRIWVEFEVSRADPVANHAKYATALLLEGLDTTDCFVSMTSRHVAQGRAALAAGAAIWMRGIGIPAYKVDLLPTLDGDAIRALNSRTLTADDLASIPVRAEIHRVIDISSAAVTTSGHRIQKADNPYTVSRNIRNWNAEVEEPDGRGLWGQRRTRFFVFDLATGLFAPSKFCAFTPGPVFDGIRPVGRNMTTLKLGMSMNVYVELGEQDPRFDGHVARMHLERSLLYRRVELQGAPSNVSQAFERWQLPRQDLFKQTSEISLLLPHPGYG